MSQVRICQLITELRPAGAERCVYELATRLDRARFDVQVVSLRGGAMADWLTAAGVKVHVLNMRGKWDLPRMAALPKLLAREKIDLLHTHLFHADLAGRWAAGTAGVPHLIHTVHTIEGRFLPWQFTFARLAADRCDKIVAVSTAVRNFHAGRSGLPMWRYRVIRNGVNAAAYASDPADRSELRRRWGIADDQVLLCFVGRLDYQKGIDVLLSAMSNLGARGKPVSLVIAGEGPQQAQVENFIAHGEGGRHTRLLGFMQDVRGVLSASDIFVLPTRGEGFPLAVAEAMAAGLPVIASDVPGLAEVLDNGRAGLMFEVNQASALVDAIEKLAADGELRSQLAQIGQQRVIEQFTIDANIAAHEQLYEEVLSSRREIFQTDSKGRRE